MNNRRILAATIPTTVENQVVEVSVSFNPGGISYATYKQEQKGFYLHVQPCKKERQAGYVVTTFMAYSGVKAFIEPAARFNAKRLNDIATNVKSLPIYTECVNHVIAKNELTLANSQPAATPATV